MNKIVRTKSHTVSKFSKTLLGLFLHAMDCGCVPILRFFPSASDGATANRQILDIIFGHFYQCDEG